tara:strand:+ start:62 stop:481 length:420 start_codon:yes stop_codon:yes gene_type:complete
LSDDVEKIIDRALGVVDNSKKEIKKVAPVVPRPNESDDVDSDYKYQRENFYNLIERGQDAVEGILDLAKESDHPRAYEVAGNLIKQVADVTEKLADLQTKMKKLKEVPNSAPKNVTNALFVGSTAELQKMLKKKDDEKG